MAVRIESGLPPGSLAKPPVWVEAGDRIPGGCDCVLDEDSVDPGNLHFERLILENIGVRGVIEPD